MPHFSWGKNWVPSCKRATEPVFSFGSISGERPRCSADPRCTVSHATTMPSQAAVAQEGMHLMDDEKNIEQKLTQVHPGPYRTSGEKALKYKGAR